FDGEWKGGVLLVFWRELIPAVGRECPIHLVEAEKGTARISLPFEGPDARCGIKCRDSIAHKIDVLAFRELITDIDRITQNMCHRRTLRCHGTLCCHGNLTRK